MNILITGGVGFIGSNFVHYILNKYSEYKIVNLDKLTYAANLDNLKELKNNYQIFNLITLIFFYLDYFPQPL